MWWRALFQLRNLLCGWGTPAGRVRLSGGESGASNVRCSAVVSLLALLCD